MSRYGDHNAKGRELTAETDRNGAPYYQIVQEMIKKHSMKEMHYSRDCLCDSCRLAGNRRYIGGGTYNVNDKVNVNTQKSVEEKLRYLKDFPVSPDPDCTVSVYEEVMDAFRIALAEREAEVRRDVVQPYINGLKEITKLLRYTGMARTADQIEANLATLQAINPHTL